LLGPNQAWVFSNRRRARGSEMSLCEDDFHIQEMDFFEGNYDEKELDREV